ncbi:MAG: MgtC/SapB family protein [Candidatus Angelobacter sp.]
MTHSVLTFVPHLSLGNLPTESMLRLLLAAALGGLIGLERELKRRPAGLRTNMFICFGAALFTILSSDLAGVLGGDHTRIAAQIIPGIGFIGAGSILHARNRGVTGLTTAATIFVVASIGMAAGGGLYLLALFSSILMFIALRVLGSLEQRFSLKSSLVNYIVASDRPASDLVGEVHLLMDRQGKELHGLHLAHGDGKQRLSFSVDATRREHKELMDALRQSDVLKNFEAKSGIETD